LYIFKIYFLGKNFFKISGIVIVISASQASSPSVKPKPIPRQIPLFQEFTLVLITKFLPGLTSFLNFT